MLARYLKQTGPSVGRPQAVRAGQFDGETAPMPGLNIDSDDEGPFVSVRTVRGLIKARPTDYIVKRKGRPHRVIPAAKFADSGFAAF